MYHTAFLHNYFSFDEINLVHWVSLFDEGLIRRTIDYRLILGRDNKRVKRSTVLYVGSLPLDGETHLWIFWLSIFDIINKLGQLAFFFDDWISQTVWTIDYRLIWANTRNSKRERYSAYLQYYFWLNQLKQRTFPLWWRDGTNGLDR